MIELKTTKNVDSGSKSFHFTLGCNHDIAECVCVKALFPSLRMCCFFLMNNPSPIQVTAHRTSIVVMYTTKHYVHYSARINKMYIASNGVMAR